MAGFGLGGNEILIIVLAAGLLFLGGKKIPELAKGLGRAMGEFQRGRMEVENELKRSLPADADTSLDDTEDTAATLPRRPKAAPPGPVGASDAGSKVVKAARALGIDTEGKSEEELKREIAKLLES